MTPTSISGSYPVLPQVGLNPHLKPRSSALAEGVHSIQRIEILLFRQDSEI